MAGSHPNRERFFRSLSLARSRCAGGNGRKARKQETWKRTKSDYSCEHWKIFTVEQQLYFLFDVNGKVLCCKQATPLSMNFNYNRPSELRTERDFIGSGDAHCWGDCHGLFITHRCNEYQHRTVAAIELAVHKFQFSLFVCQAREINLVYCRAHRQRERKRKAKKSHKIACTLHIDQPS